MCREELFSLAVSQCADAQSQLEEITHAPQPAVWSDDKEWEPVPVRGNAERPLPHARRDVTGRSKG
jgi:hypothetical protein